MTHAGMAPEARAAAGISETLLRISTGIEDGEDLIADLENGFRAQTRGKHECDCAGRGEGSSTAQIWW
jgi:cystathionine gamma-synthase